jgi:hypothetical protein
MIFRFAASVCEMRCTNTSGVPLSGCAPSQEPREILGEKGRDRHGQGVAVRFGPGRDFLEWLRR